MTDKEIVIGMMYNDMRFVYKIGSVNKKGISMQNKLFMKKITIGIIAMLFAACTVFSLGACTPKASDDVQPDVTIENANSDIIGTWKLVSATSQNTEIPLADMGEQFAALEYTFTFAENGECTVSMMGTSAVTDYTYIDGAIVFSNPSFEAIELVKSGDRLTWENSGAILNFERQ